MYCAFPYVLITNHGMLSKLRSIVFLIFKTKKKLLYVIVMS